ncbi:MAG TPA: hypothetical protein VLM80_04705 [Anaerolineales bacterium]|nr:hypothetical protein [Anaerolineales bacterium]
MCNKLFIRFKFRFLLIGGLLLLWWWVKYIQEQEDQALSDRSTSILLDKASPSIPTLSESQVKAKKASVVPTKSEPVPAPKQKSNDDLRRIEGIGPKISTTLVNAGIDSFDQLSKTKPEVIKNILEKANITLARPDTWPEQARLAAAGNWQELEAFQGQLKGGRRV